MTKPVPPLQRLFLLIRDLAYGLHAGNAIRHGLPVPPRRCR
ncbi:hypothetical protein [Amycolatopsis nigrescens]|nr:hypothetical protein [Amycolatopsis nigrescens]